MVARLRRRGPLRRGSSIGYCGRGRFLTRRRPYWPGPTREYYLTALAAFGTDLASRDALAVLTVAPSPELGRRLSQARIETLLRRAGRQRNISSTAATIRAALTSEQLAARPGVIGAYTASASALLAVLSTMAAQAEVLAGQVGQGFGQHPDVEIYRSQPGLGVILGARVLAEFGDDPDRYVDAKARKNYSGMAPITKASGTKRVVLARFARNRRLGDALFLQAFAKLNNSPGARAFYDRQRAPRRHPLPSPPHPREPARRHPPRLLTKPYPLRRTPRLAHRTRQTQPCSLTASSRGMSSQCVPRRTPAQPASLVEFAFTTSTIGRVTTRRVVA